MRPVRPLLLVGGGIIGGVELHVLGLIAAFCQHNLSPLVVAPFMGEFTQALLAAGVPARDVLVVEMSDQLHLPSLSTVAWLCRSRGITILHSHLRGADVIAGPVGALVGVPTLSTLHGVVRSTHEVLLHRLYDLEFVAVSEAGRISAVTAGIMPASVHVIHNGIDVQRFDPACVDRREARRSLHLPEDELLVTFMGRLMPEKDPMAVFDVAARLRATHPHARCLIVGTGALAAQVGETAVLHPNVTVLGLRHDVATILGASDVLLLPSRSESLPLVVLEAMAMQVPVVAYDVGGVREAVSDSTGCLVPPGQVDALTTSVATLLDDLQRRRRLGRAARAMVRARFTHTRCGANVVDHYQALEADFARRRADIGSAGIARCS